MAIDEADEGSSWRAAWRAALGRCPRCGKGRLFGSYLKAVPACAACGEPLGHIQADDGPAWLTIMIVGHIVVFTALGAAPMAGAWPGWVPMVLWPGLALVLSLTFLPVAKGVFIGAIWATKSPGSERE